MTDEWRLTSAQRARLQSQAHHLEPSVQVGKLGLTDAVVAAAERSLLAHELIKVRLTGDREARDAGARALAERTGAAVAGAVGRIVILYRAHPDPEKRSIQLD